MTGRPEQTPFGPRLASCADPSVGAPATARAARVPGEMSGFALGQYWVSADRERFAEVTGVSGDNWVATVSITDAKGHRLTRMTVDLVQFRGQWRLVPEEL